MKIIVGIMALVFVLSTENSFAGNYRCSNVSFQSVYNPLVCEAITTSKVCADVCKPYGGWAGGFSCQMDKNTCPTQSACYCVS